MYSVQVLSFLAVFAGIFVIAAADAHGRLLDGQPVDTITQFPHHVYIVVFESGQRCGGTILNDRWILTSASCVKHGIRLDIFFRKMQQFDVRGDFFSISVNRDQVFVYPTNFDDIALIKVPTALVFSESLSPVSISKLPIEALRDRFTVMPGFSDFLTTTTFTTTTRTTPTITTTRAPTTVKTSTPSTTTTTYWPTTTTNGIPNPPSPATDYSPGVPLPNTPAPTPPSIEVSPPSVARSMGGDNLKYGMFSVVNSRICKKQLGSGFDEYTQLCIESWGDNPNRPCDSDYGSGLIVGWPAKSELVGLYSMASPGCSTNQPAVFTFVGKYMGWIESMIRG